MQQITITDREAGQRLDRLLEKYMKSAPKSFFYKMLRKKNITLNGKKAAGRERLEPGDEIKLFLADETIAKFREGTTEFGGSLRQVERGRGQNNDVQKEIQKYCLEDSAIIFEDNNILVVNKPQGILSQKSDKSDISMVEYIAEYLSRQNGVSDTFQPGICNRLDRNTTGLIVAGKSIHGLQWMNELFRERTLQKYYLCIVEGKVDQGRRIDAYLVKDAKQNTVTIVNQPGAGAERILTEYEPLQYGIWKRETYTLLRVHLITGKSHQIRAHLSSIGHPLIGDTKYGQKETNQMFRQCFQLRYQLLHAWELYLPENDVKLPKQYWGQRWVAPLPQQFLQIMTEMGMKVSDITERGK